MTTRAYVLPALVAALVGGAVLAGLIVVGYRARRARRLARVEQQEALREVELLDARIAALTTQVTQLAARPGRVETRAQPLVGTIVSAVTSTAAGVPTRDPASDPARDPLTDTARLLHAVERGRPVWLPAQPVREALVKTVSLAYGVRRALSAEHRERILDEVRATTRRSRRQRRQELKAFRKQQRDQRHSAA